ncbi:hypothetical protein [Paramagnetospirillum magneticum]|uniref:hypothetical protein n=1 Tax=Paramagnetospirillum magneticum TaxID=84159 RepID=UPI0005C1D6A6|nr:hypothetical protein [Paramagnetospirillum magneticum]
MDSKTKLQARIRDILASATGSNDNAPSPHYDWSAHIARREQEDRLFVRRLLIKTAVAFLAVSPFVVYASTTWGGKVKALINHNQIRAATAYWANQAEMLANIPDGDEEVVAVVGEGVLADCRWMTKADLSDLLKQPGARLLNRP